MKACLGSLKGPGINGWLREDAVRVRECVSVRVRVCVERGGEALFQVLFSPSAPPAPSPPPPACLSPLPTLYNGLASAPPQTPGASWIGSLVPDAQASQLSSQSPFASWHPQEKLVACLPPLVGRTPPSSSLPDVWSTRATNFGTAQADLVTSGLPWCAPRCTRCPW